MRSAHPLARSHGSRSARRAALLALVPALALGAASPAAARPEPPAAAPVDKKELAQAKAGEGLARFDKGEWQPALDAFAEAEKLVHAPTLVLYMARCKQKLGKLLEARGLYEQVVAEAVPKDAPEAWAKGHAEAVAEIAALRAQIPSLSVTVVGAGGASRAAQAKATLDQLDLPLGQAREVDPGEHRLEVVVPGAPPVSRAVVLAPGRSLEIAVPVELPPPPPPRAPPAPPPPPRWPTALAGTAFGVGAAGLVLGAVAGAMTASRVSDLNAACPNGTCPSNAFGGEAGAARSLQALTVTGLVLGGAGVVTGTLVLALGPRAADASPAAATASLRLGVGHVGLEGSF